MKKDFIDLWGVQSAQDIHFFHIHINPFQVISRDIVQYAYPVWRDTVLINCATAASEAAPGYAGCAFNGSLTFVDGKYPNTSGEVVQFLSQALDFTGDMVLHCHNVLHEDNGMMELVSIVD